MNKLIDRFMISKGYVCGKEKLVRGTIEIKSYEDAIWNERLQPIFPLEISFASDIFAHRMIPGKNVYVDALIGERMEYSNSVLKKYYEEFQPQSLRDVFIDGTVAYSTPKSNGLYSYLLPWNIRPKENAGKPLAYSGPMDTDRGMTELLRLYEVFDSIKKNGYCPKMSAHLFNSNHVQGYFLRRDSDYRFIVLHGKHRVAAMAALEESHVLATFDLLHPRVIDYIDIENWPQVANGTYDKEFAKMVFDAFFV